MKTESTTLEAHLIKDILNFIVKVLGLTGMRNTLDDLISSIQKALDKESTSSHKHFVIIKLSSAELKGSTLTTFRKKKYVHLHELGDIDYSMVSPQQKI